MAAVPARAATPAPNAYVTDQQSNTVSGKRDAGHGAPRKQQPHHD
ncbi:hypothetical protein ABZ845_30225 [Streptomyces sp. NPDC047022]